jgi:hypothetical protein
MRELSKPKAELAAADPSHKEGNKTATAALPSESAVKLRMTTIRKKKKQQSIKALTEQDLGMQHIV